MIMHQQEALWRAWNIKQASNFLQEKLLSPQLNVSQQHSGDQLRKSQDHPLELEKQAGNLLTKMKV